MKRCGARLAHFLLWIGCISISTPLDSSGATSFDGVWESRGYGYVLSINGSLVSEFEITSTTCVEGFTAQLHATGHGKWDGSFTSKEGSFFIKDAESGNHAVLHLQDSVPDIHIDRISGIPAICNRPTENTPAGNFEVFTRTWAENYISFELRQADWNKIVAEYRPKVSSQTTRGQLFEIFESMIKPLGDIHTYVAAPPLYSDVLALRHERSCQR